MHTHKKLYLSLTLFFIAFLLSAVGRYAPTALTFYFSSGIGQYLPQLLSQLTGVFPFSIAEFGLYLLILLGLLALLFTLYRSFSTPKNSFKYISHFCLNFISILFCFYFLFMITWGLNYYRPLISETLSFTSVPYKTEDLGNLYRYLVQKTNALREEVNENEAGVMHLEGSYEDVFERAYLGYEAFLSSPLGNYFSHLKGSYGNPKPLALSKAMTYTGITGVYSPYTGEANVNTAILDAFLPSTTMHEMAHQRGYANEDECNFLAFLTCDAHPDPDFAYSGYLLALIHTHNALYENDANLLWKLYEGLSPKVQADLGAQTQFVKSHEGVVEAISSKVNDTYLKVNGIEDGEASYGRMVELLLSYYTTMIQNNT